MKNNLLKLKQYLPAETAPVIFDWIQRTNCHFRVAKSRKTKLGDYRHPWGTQGHRISVNGDLNPYAFLLTTVHEFAHLKTWNEYQNRVAPHGPEWKKNFRHLMAVIMRQHALPEDVTRALNAYLQNPAASSCTDLDLFRVLKKYDPVDQHTGEVHVENIPEGGHFMLRNGRIFRRMHQLRKRFLCVEVKTQRTYLFSPIAMVKPHEKKHNDSNRNETYP